MKPCIKCNGKVTKMFWYSSNPFGLICLWCRIKSERKRVMLEARRIQLNAYINRYGVDLRRTR